MSWGKLLFVIGTIIAATPLTAFALPLAIAGDPTAEFKFVVPPLPGRKTTVGENAGWGGLFVSFTQPVNTVAFSADPVLDDCVDQAAAPVNADNQFGAAPADSWLWTCRNGYQLDPQEHKGLTVTIKVTSDDPIVLVLDKANSPDPMNTFWWQKQDVAPDSTLRFFTGRDDAPPAKLAAFPTPEPSTLVLLVASFGILLLSSLHRTPAYKDDRRGGE